MKILLFLARVAFIYNVCMTVTLLMDHFNLITNEEIRPALLLGGFFLSILFNGLTCLWMVVMLVVKRSLKIFHPAWLFIVNILCFIFQLYMFLK